ncbi:Ff.00g064640.m01.CDS01 [Fusarium sp. VM40]|nr:Ff.00g064640.m01.CDS01 [Fusarium sp. VM40]
MVKRKFDALEPGSVSLPCERRKTVRSPQEIHKRNVAVPSPKANTHTSATSTDLDGLQEEEPHLKPLPICLLETLDTSPYGRELAWLDTDIKEQRKTLQEAQYEVKTIREICSEDKLAVKKADYLWRYHQGPQVQANADREKTRLESLEGLRAGLEENRDRILQQRAFYESVQRLLDERAVEDGENVLEQVMDLD